MERPTRHVPTSRRLCVAGAAVALSLLAVACGGTEAGPSASMTTATTATTGSALPPTTVTERGTTTTPVADLHGAACAGTLEVASEGRVAAETGDELSGIVASRANQRASWVHDDSGAGPLIYAIDGNGSLLATYDLGVEAIDWEDIAIGRSADVDDGWSLVVGDIGDNAEARPSVQLRIVEEPVIAPPGSDPAVARPVDAVATVDLTYPDKPHNAEALVLDPDTGQLVIITKEVLGPAQVFVADGSELVDGATVTLTAAGSVDFGSDGLPSWVTAADVSPDGSVIAVRTYGGVHLFARAEGQSIAEALATSPCEGPRPLEAQGEAIAISADGTSYVTVSEGAEPILHRTS